MYILARDANVDGMPCTTACYDTAGREDIYIYIYVDLCTYIYICTHCLSLSLSLYIYIYIHIYIYICICQVVVDCLFFSGTVV